MSRKTEPGLGLPRRQLRFVAPPSLGAGHGAARRLEAVLARHLSALESVEVTVVESYAELGRLLTAGHADLGWAPPLVGARVEANGGRMLARSVRLGAATCRAALIARAGGAVDPSSLVGLRAVWVDRESTCGYLLPRAWIRGLGFDPDRIFSEERFVGTYAAAVQEVALGRADVTSVYAASASARRPYIGIDDLPPATRALLSPIALTVEAPNDGVVAAPGLDDETAAYLRRRLVSLTDDPEGPGVLAEIFHADSFEDPPEHGPRAMQELVLATFGLGSTPTACSACGARVPREARYCDRCGAPIRRASWVPPPLAGPASIDPASMGGRASGPQSQRAPDLGEGSWFEERKLATVLFGDLSSFTDLSSRLEPDAVRELANACFEPLSAEIERHGGRVVKYIGDGVLAVFGVPKGQEDDPRRAVTAALSMRHRLSEVSKRLEPRLGAPVRMRIGINTGWLMVGTVGGRGQLDVMGWTVNVASRIEGVAHADEILIGHATHRLCEGDFDVEALGPMRLRGVSEPIPLYRVLGERVEDSRASEGKPRTLAVLREAELDAIERAFDEVVAQSSPRVVEIVADSGLGKGRLVDLFCARVAAGPARPEILRAGGVLGATEAAAPLSLFERLLRRRFGVRGDEAAAAVRDRLVRGVAAAWEPGDPAAARPATLLAELAAFVAPSGSDVPASSREPMGSPEAVIGALAAWLRRLGESRPVCLVLSNLQWADDRSLDLVEQLPRHLAGAPVFFLLTARPEIADRGRLADSRVEHRPLPWLPGALRMSLGALPHDVMSRWLESLTGDARLPERLQAELIARAEGNPEFLRQLVRLLVDRGALLVGDDGRPAGLRPERLGAIELPETVQGALQARLDGLPWAEREVLRRAAVVGRIFWLGALEALCEAQSPGPSEVAALCESLEAKGLVREARTAVLAGERELEFATQALRDITYQSIPRHAREAAHLRIASWLRERGGAARVAYAEIAGHLAAGGAVEEARSAYVQAARHAARLFANEDAVRLFERALDGWVDARLAERATVRRELAALLGRAGRYDEALASLDAAQHDLEALGVPEGDPTLGWIEIERARILKDRGDNAGVVAAVDRGLAVAGRGQAGVLSMMLYALRAFARFEQGDVAGARADCEEGLRIGEGRAGRGATRAQATARLYNTLGGIHLVAEGDLDGAARCYEHARRLRASIGDEQGELDALVNLGAIAFERRAFADAASLFERGLALARRAHWVKYVAVCESNLGQARLCAGDAAGALSTLEEAERLAEQAGMVEVRADTARALAEAELAVGRAELALSCAERAVELARDAKSPRFEAAAHRVAIDALAAGALAEGGAERAREHRAAAAALLRGVSGAAAEAEIAALDARVAAIR